MTERERQCGGRRGRAYHKAQNSNDAVLLETQDLYSPEYVSGTFYLDWGAQSPLLHHHINPSLPSPSPHPPCPTLSLSVSVSCFFRTFCPVLLSTHLPSYTHVATRGSSSVSFSLTSHQRGNAENCWAGNSGRRKMMRRKRERAGLVRLDWHVGHSPLSFSLLIGNG